MNNRLDVFVNQKKAGELWLDPHRRFCFQYDTDWLASPDSHRLSVSLPLIETPFLNDTPYAYFTNLLPEGDVLGAISRKLQISVNNPFDLLREIGGDCAGAVSLYEPGITPPKPSAYAYRPMTREHLAQVIKDLPMNPFMADEKGIRLSLAGAQDKLPVFIKDDQILISLNGAPSTHILKPPIKGLSETVENETFCMMLADKMGIDVPRVKIIRVDDLSLYMITRYDRENQNGRIIRLIQEDFCQALNVSAQLKYSPTLETCFALIRKESTLPIKDVKRLLHLIIFNGLIGNSDAHAKNISFLHGRNGTVLAPFYDLLSTWVYPYAKKMAMKLGGGRHFQFLEPAHFKRFAETAGISYKAVETTVLDMAGRISGAAEETTGLFYDRYGKSPVIEEINRIIKNASREKLAAFSSHC
jgi:serine/threonine-protein kinase HipA